jgi:methionine-gamma-lyase
MSNKKLKFDSMLIHGSGMHDEMGSAVTPIYQTSTFGFKSADHGAACFAGEDDGYIYTRLGNPTIEAMEKTIASLEGGFGAIGVSSGMAAVNTIYMALLNQGDHMIGSAAVYGPSRVVMETQWSRFGVEASFVHTCDLENIKAALKPNTKMIYIETPANPTLEITDLQLVSDFAKENNLLLVVDNTFCSPVLQRPIEFGADVVFHSMTKFLNGHADVVAGVVVAKTEELYNRLANVMKNLGCNMDPHQAFLVHRGLKTLTIRVEKAQENAIKVFDMIKNHPNTEWALYPGSEDHPQYDVYKKQMDGPGSLISFGVKGGIEAGKKVMNAVEMAMLAVSLGGVETLIQHPASMTHSKMTPEAREKAGITDGLIRLAVGIEDVDDIIDDLKHALDSI